MGFLRLKELLKDKGVTGKELAEKVGVTENAISMIINDKRQPRFDLLRRVAEVLDVDIRNLFYSTKESNKETIYIKKDGDLVAVGELNI